MPTPPAVPNGLDQLISTFGDLRPYIQDDGTLSAKWETDQMTRIVLPFPMPVGTHPVQSATRMECHHLLAEVFLATLDDIVTAGLRDKIHTYDGCFAGRAQRGAASHWSCHAWGIAIDLNTATNPLGGPGDMDPGIIEVFQKRGFLWGGNFHGRKDPMHFQYCTGY